MTVLSTFLKSSLIFLFNNRKKHYKIGYSQREKRYQSLNCQKHSLKGYTRPNCLQKPTCSEQMTVLTTFVEFSLIFLTNNLKNTRKFSTVREKSGIKV